VEFFELEEIFDYTFDSIIVGFTILLKKKKTMKIS